MAITLEEKKEEKLEEEGLEDFDLGELEILMPTLSDVADVLAAALGIHYLDKVVGYLPEFAGKWTKLIVAYLIYKFGGRYHRILQMAGFGMLARSAEELIAPYLPGSPSVFSKNEKPIVKDAYTCALEYAYGGGK
ncbi:MAG: hypothetical protein QXO15_05255 [Nitrososphaerota archaeon]